MNGDQNIPQLPPEMIVHISKYLNVEDKLKLRLINKEFKKTFDYLIRLDQLTLISNETIFNHNWFYTNRPNREVDLNKLNNKNILNNLFKNNLFLNVKKLFFDFEEIIDFNKTINQFKYLEQLNIYCKIESNSILSLSKLKILRIYLYDFDNFKIELETPSLSILKCSNSDICQFNYPEKIIYLDDETINTIDYNYNYNRIEIFKNLEYFILLSEIGDFGRLKPIISTKLIYLKELHFNRPLMYKADFIKIKEIYEYKLKLKNLRIFLYGVDFENLKELDIDQLSKNDSFDLIFNNYSNTSDIISFIDEMNFDKLFEFLNSNSTISIDNIIYKFPNINSIFAYELDEKNIDCFYEYLSKCDNLSSLDLGLLTVNQIYYLHKLPNSCKEIRHLHLNNLNIDESTNLDFLFKFKKLHHLSLGKLGDLNILEKFRSNLKFSIDFKFIYMRFIFQISYTNNEYIYRNRKFNSNDLLEHLEKLIDRNFK